MAAEPWWRSAVFYRLTPEHFQDSDGDGVGDLRGVAARLDYLQVLGVDAVVLQLPFNDDGFDDLLAEASRRHIRLVVGLARSEEGTPESDRLQGQARQWLARGAAGILLPPASVANVNATTDAAEDALRRSLRRIAFEYPGERVVIASPLHIAALREPVRPSAKPLRPDRPQLTRTPLALPAASLTPSAVAAALTQASLEESSPLLELSIESSPPTETGKIAAAVLLTQCSAILLDYGQELGTVAPRRMPWTPTNVTPAPEPAPASEPSTSSANILTPPAPVVYGPYRPYVPPEPKPKASVLPTPVEPGLPDPDTLAGFSTQHAPPDEAPADVPGVALQERDPSSLLNLYRRLLALHHGNATLRSGSLVLLRASDGAVVWLRRAPAGARTVATVIVAANCGDQATTLSLAPDFARMHLRAPSLRPLLPGGKAWETMSIDRLTLAPHGIFIGELLHDR